ncbi:site-specific DNA-methyltransferase [Patescibacteria group bacterium]|nr:site-specific DNA-methyltransferase [Patescibacteria group bacterium]
MNKIFNEDVLLGIDKIENNSIDLLLIDPPYCLGKDYGNDSDQKSSEEYLNWTYQWIDAVLPKLKKNGSFYIFLSWQYSPEIFVYLKKKLRMVNEIIWDRRVPSMGGSIRKFSSVHDNIGFFVKNNDYYFDIDSIRIPYDEETKKARTRSIFVGKKWLEMGYNPKDLWSASRIHAQDPERENHPTQKPLEIIERMVKASCPKNGVVFDPFMGTGTTAIACLKNDRQYVGFEINKDYYNAIMNRIEKHNNCPTLFQQQTQKQNNLVHDIHLKPFFLSSN